jgi:hypothetical protein
VVVILTGAGYFFYHKGYHKTKLVISPNENLVSTMDKIQEDIKNNQILTVEGLAE